MMNDDLAGLTDRLMASYVREGGINHVEGKNLPSKHAIADITVDLLRLLFPGFFDEKLIHFSEIGAVTGALLDRVLSRLENEITKSLEYAPPAGIAGADPHDLARTITLKFLGNRLRFENCSKPTPMRLTAAIPRRSARKK